MESPVSCAGNGERGDRNLNSTQKTGLIVKGIEDDVIDPSILVYAKSRPIKVPPFLKPPEDFVKRQTFLVGLEQQARLDFSSRLVETPR
jgi:hypothetical protein